MNLITLPPIGREWFTNAISSRIEKPYSLLFYVIESADWVIRQVGIDITTNLNNQKLLKAKITTAYKGVRNQIIHFGSVNTFLTSKGFRMPNKSNKVVLTWFHVVPDDLRIKFVTEAQKYADLVHTSSTITKEKLIEIGISEGKVVVIPLGVDLSLFKPVSSEQKQEIRKQIGIPLDKIVIGSFQKDGVGWGEGLEPKIIKGPDILCDVLKVLNCKYSVHVLLTGPARGYVKKRLEEDDIPYTHLFLKNYFDIAEYYKALDLYLVTSREEGGPKAIFETMACGIPLVTTDVGMAKDAITEGENGFICDDRKNPHNGLIEKSEYVINKLDKDTYKRTASTASRKYDWTKITRLYYDKIYSKLLHNSANYR